jgi:hypothetical protein
MMRCRIPSVYCFLKCGRLALLFAVGYGPIAACAQDPLVTLPNNYRVVLDNSDVAVIRAHYGAHEKIPVHDHTAFATVFVYLNDSGAVRIDHVGDGKVESVVRPPTVKGAYRVAPGIAERHSIENLGDTSSEFLRVELKKVSLDLKEPFRGKAPQSLAEGMDSVEFTAPGVQIERIVCVGPSPCAVKSSTGPSLVIAFTPLYLGTGSAGKEKLGAGAVRWMPASEGATITPEGYPGIPGHILRILLPAVPK